MNEFLKVIIKLKKLFKTILRTLDQIPNRDKLIWLILGNTVALFINRFIKNTHIILNTKYHMHKHPSFKLDYLEIINH